MSWSTAFRDFFGASFAIQNIKTLMLPGTFWASQRRPFRGMLIFMQFYAVLIGRKSHHTELVYGVSWKLRRFPFPSREMKISNGIRCSLAEFSNVKTLTTWAPRCSIMLPANAAEDSSVQFFMPHYTLRRSEVENHTENDRFTSHRMREFHMGTMLASLRPVACQMWG